MTKNFQIVLLCISFFLSVSEYFLFENLAWAVFDGMLALYWAWTLYSGV